MNAELLPWAWMCVQAVATAPVLWPLLVAALIVSGLALTERRRRR